ncbi:hypothetical protein [Absidia glauca]|uniref:Uncharacterized protein n=1 Tax=Absidia glauca TaxID=4829 RepID=A0A168PSJ3_ABSGL|nr:hypothetical protein [Absidia glauca]
MAKSKTAKPTTKAASSTITPTKQIKKSHKQRVKGTSEADNPKYANKDFMLELITATAAKESQREDQKIAKKMAVEKLIEEKENKKQVKLTAKQKQLEEAKQRYLDAKSKKKNKKHKTKKESTDANKKKVRFA